MKGWPRIWGAVLLFTQKLLLTLRVRGYYSAGGLSGAELLQAPSFSHDAKLILQPLRPLEAQEDFSINSTNPCVQIPAPVIAGCLWF